MARPDRRPRLRGCCRGDEAQWIAEQASGGELDGAPTKVGRWRTSSRWSLAAPAGEPLAVRARIVGVPRARPVGRRRVLIPRPETEQVVEVALTAARAMLADRRRWWSPTSAPVRARSRSRSCTSCHSVAPTSGRPTCPDDALAVARANLAGVGRAAAAVRLARGAAGSTRCPAELRGALRPRRLEPALRRRRPTCCPPRSRRGSPSARSTPGPPGSTRSSTSSREAPAWLAPHGVLVVEIGETQGSAVLALARAAGFTDAAIHQDLAGRDRILLAVPELHPRPDPRVLGRVNRQI